MSKKVRPLQEVYFIQCGPHGPIKIGIAKDAKARLLSLQTANPVRLALIASVPGTFQLERELHARFAEGLIANEWFERDTPGLLDLVAYILRHGSLPGPSGGFEYVCERCWWPMEDELGDRGLRECWRCIQDRLKEEDRNGSARVLNQKVDVCRDRDSP